MSRHRTVWIAAVLSAACAQAPPQPSQATGEVLATTANEPPRSGPASSGGGAHAVPLEIISSTEHVEDLALDDEALWVATRGGLERYGAPDFRDRRLFGPRDGLDAAHVHALSLSGRTLVATTTTGRCTLEQDRFHCVPERTPPEPRLARPGALAGRRVTVTIGSTDRRFVGTAGAGVWKVGSEERRLTPTGQLCGNHVTSMVRHSGALWVGTFNHGLCRSTDGRRFERVEGPFRMVNDLEATSHGLFIAATEGLYALTTAGTWRRVPGIAQAGVSSLAFDGRWLYATTPGALWLVEPAQRTLVQSWWRPAGSRALQAVAYSSRGVWLASEDRGAILFDGEQFRAIDRTAGLPTSWMLDATAAADGSAYVATLRQGVLRVTPDGRWAAVAGLPDRWIFRVWVDDGALWAGTQDGAARIPAAGRPLELGGLPDPRVHAFLRVGDRVLVGTEAGIAVYRADA